MIKRVITLIYIVSVYTSRNSCVYRVPDMKQAAAILRLRCFTFYFHIHSRILGVYSPQNFQSCEPGLS